MGKFNGFFLAHAAHHILVTFVTFIALLIPDYCSKYLLGCKPSLLARYLSVLGSTSKHSRTLSVDSNQRLVRLPKLPCSMHELLLGISPVLQYPISVF